MPKYRKKEDKDFVVEVEIVEEEGNFYAKLTPQQDVTLHLDEDQTLSIGRDPWCVDLPTFVKRYEPVHKRDWELG